VRVAGGLNPPCFRRQPPLLIAHLTRRVGGGGLKGQRRGRGREGRGGSLVLTPLALF
jgi:hypothetical protein